MGVSPDAKAFQGLFDFLSRIERPRRGELLPIERAVRRGFLDNFGRQSVGGGSAWAPLAPRTQAERVRQGYNPAYPILVRGGSYIRSWTSQGGWTMFVPSVTGWNFYVGSDHRWSFVHERGDRALNLPARPVRYLDNAGMGTVARAVNDWIDYLIRTVL